MRKNSSPHICGSGYNVLLERAKTFMKNTARFHFLYAIADALVCFTIMIFAFLSHYGVQDFMNHALHVFLYSGVASLVTVVAFFATQVYKIITREFGLVETLRIMAVTFLVHLAGLIILLAVPGFPEFRSFVFPFLLAVAVLIYAHPGLRVLVRIFNMLRTRVQKKTAVPTIVIGAGSMGKLVIDESRKNKDNHNRVVAVVDDDPNKTGGLFANIPVKGPVSDIATVIDYFQAEEVIIAMSNISQERLHEIFTLLEPCAVRVRRMPLISEMEGPNDKRIIDVDLNDLLYRDPVKLDNSEVKNMLHGKTVLVTGAGGSIGSELVRQIFRTHPKTLVLFDIYENSTYDIQMELTRIMREEKIHDIELVTLIGSTYNEFRVEQVIKKYKPDYIYHAAAYKHVPLMEDSPAEAIRTNVIGTYNVAKMADKYGVKKMVLVSTDKAVRPTNVMGATKRFAETIIQYFSSKSKHTAYAAVRFGNVLGSNGSVVPLFKKQIEAGGPVTITHKDIIRYFMTIPEAVSLILQCGLFAEGGEIFILDMGKPVKIINLAERLIRQAGLVPYVDIDIVETGLRPGEKLFEELLLDTEHQKKTPNKRIYIEEKEQIMPIEEEIPEISKVFGMEETKDVKELLSSIITTYKITENKDN